MAQIAIAHRLITTVGSAFRIALARDKGVMRFQRGGNALPRHPLSNLINIGPNTNATKNPAV
jgi:hypothetical protein